jgi:signal transduction histidine kinase/ligand-binding sensor domain-containing protein
MSRLTITRATLLLLGCLMAVGNHAGTDFGDDPDYLIKAWETDHGLPENSATAMAQTPDGYLWIGTFEGLVRFDGAEFAVFNRSNTPELPSNGIVNLHLDRLGRLWVSTYEGLAVLESGRWRQFTRIEGGIGDYARTFAERSNGDILITAFNGNLFEVSNGQIARLPAPPGEPGQGYLGGVDEDGHWWAVQNRFIGRWIGGRWVSTFSPPNLSADAVGCAPARDGAIWLLLGRELLKLRRTTVITRVTLPETSGGVWGLTEDSGGGVWITTHNAGVCRVTTSGATLRWNAVNGGSDHGRFVFEDREHNLWVGTSGDGLMRFTPRRFHYRDLVSGRRGLVVQSVYPDGRGGVLAGTYGRGVYHVGDSNSARMALPGGANGVDYLQSVLQDRTGRLWVGTYGNALWLVENETALHVPQERVGGHNVLALFEDSRGQVWMNGGGSVVAFDGTDFHAFGPQQGLPAGGNFAEDTSGMIWTSSGEGVFRQESERRFAELRVDGHPIHGIACLLPDANGSMWLGSSDRGLLRWKDGTIDSVDSRHGFPVITVHGMVEDNEGFFWVTSGTRIVRVRRNDLHAAADGLIARFACQTFDASDGLPNAEFIRGRQPTAARDERGRLWFATSKGVVMTEPATLQLNTNPPPVHLREISFYQRAPAPSEASNARPGSTESQSRLTGPFVTPVSLPAGSRRIEIHYAALSFSAPEKIRYQIKLEGQDLDWQEMGNRRVSYYHELAPRPYTFRVRAANNDGTWNETGASLAFSVQPYYWQKAWFQLAAIAALINLGGVGAWWRSRSKHRRELEELERNRRHQAELTHFGRVSTMGQLASSLAHELNQPLGAILRNAEAAELFLKSSPPDIEEVRAILADIRHDDRRAGDVIDRMRALLKRREFQADQLDANALVAEVAALLRPDAEARKTRLVIEPSSSMAQVLGDRVQLQQVLLNLLLNAMDAMSDSPPPSRRVTVRVRAMRDDVEISISDVGPGIRGEDLKRLFDPFFTTKANGLGMGLAISHTIIASHQGRITAENNENGGATFRFTLPTTAPHSAQT